MGKIEKLHRILACPECRSHPLRYTNAEITCDQCAETYPVIHNAPFLLKRSSPVREWYLTDVETYQAQPVKNRIKNLLKTPEDRLWSRHAKRTIRELLLKINPDDPNRVVINVGVGFESVFRRAFAGYEDVIRIGLPHLGTVDAFGDAMDYPVADSSVDLLFSCSVIEHLRDPELAIREIHRILKPGGMAYAEIEFLRALHMAPVDFTRYTIPGIISVFERNGFATIDKGISSGPFTAVALFLRDFAVEISPRPEGRFLSRVISSWLVQPIKYLDWIFNNFSRASALANNLFYLGEKR